MFQNWMKKKVEDTLDQPEQHETMASMDVPDMDYYFIMGDVPKQDESLTKSLKTRIKPLADQHKRTAILTLNYDANVKERIHRMGEFFSPEVDILNVYEHYILPESGSKRRYSEFIVGESLHSINEAVIPADESTIQVTRYELPASPFVILINIMKSSNW